LPVIDSPPHRVGTEKREVRIPVLVAFYSYVQRVSGIQRVIPHTGAVPAACTPQALHSTSGFFKVSGKKRMLGTPCRKRLTHCKRGIVEARVPVGEVIKNLRIIS